MAFIPDPEHLGKIFAQAAAPAFFLGAVTGLVSILMGRLSSITDRLNAKGRAAREAPAGVDEKTETAWLVRRAILIHQAIWMTLSGGICTAFLLVISFAAGFFHLEHAYGAGLMFVLASGLVGAGLIRFTQEIRLALRELDPYRG